VLAIGWCSCRLSLVEIAKSLFLKNEKNQFVYYLDIQIPEPVKYLPAQNLNLPGA